MLDLAVDEAALSAVASVGPMARAYADDITRFLAAETTEGRLPGLPVRELTLRDLASACAQYRPHGVYVFFGRYEGRAQALYVGVCRSRWFLDRIPAHLACLPVPPVSGPSGWGLSALAERVARLPMATDMPPCRTTLDVLDALEATLVVIPTPNGFPRTAETPEARRQEQNRRSFAGLVESALRCGDRLAPVLNLRRRAGDDVEEAERMRAILDLSADGEDDDEFEVEVAPGLPEALQGTLLRGQRALLVNVGRSWPADAVGGESAQAQELAALRAWRLSASGAKTVGVVAAWRHDKVVGAWQVSDARELRPGRYGFEPVRRLGPSACDALKAFQSGPMYCVTKYIAFNGSA